MKHVHPSPLRSFHAGSSDEKYEGRESYHACLCHARYEKRADCD